MLKDRLVAHRGFRHKFPENTLLAMSEAIAVGAHYLETDIQLTADLEPVLCHDINLTRCCGLDVSIHDLSSGEALLTSAGESTRLGDQFSGERIPSLQALAELLRQHSHVSAFIEAKEESIARFGRETVYQRIADTLAPVRDQSVIISFDQEFVALARSKGFPSTGLVIRNWTQIDSPETLAMAPDYIFCNARLIPEDDDPARFSPLLVVYEIASPALAAQLFARGIDMVETFDIGGMLGELSHHSL